MLANITSSTSFGPPSSQSKDQNLITEKTTPYFPLTNEGGTSINYGILGVRRESDFMTIDNDRIHRYCPPANLS